MKRKLSLLLLLLLSVPAFSQEYKKKIAQASCECTAKLKSENLNPDDITAQLGLCVIKASMPYAAEIKKDFNIDIMDMASYNDQSMAKFFESLSLFMMAECPETFSDFIKSDDSKKNANTSKKSSIQGTVVKIEKNDFVVFHLMDDNKNLKKLYWITAVQSNLDLSKEYNSLLNKKVNAGYYTADIFDAKINDYKNLSIISSLKTD